MRRCMLVVMLAGALTCVGAVGAVADLIWSVETIDGVNLTRFCAPSIAVDALGQPHVSYFDYRNGKLKYAVRVGGTWHTEDVLDTIYQGSSIAIDSAGHPHIVCVGSSGELLHVVHDGSAWSTETVEAEGAAGGVDMALDSSDQPHIAQLDASTGALKYVHWTGSEWDAEVVAADADNFSLALDLDERPHIAYFSGGLRHVGWNGTAWEDELLDPEGWRTLKLAVSIWNELWVGYAGRSNNAKIARRLGTTWYVYNMVNANVDTFVTLALEHPNWAHLIYDYYDGTYPQTLKDCHRNASEWNEQSITPFLESSQAKAQFDDLGHCHVVYWDANPEELRYAWGQNPLAVRWPR